MCPPMWAHWRHLANMIELLLPSAHPSPQPKRQIDRFSCFCTAHDRKSLYFTMGNPFPQIAPSHEGYGPHSSPSPKGGAPIFGPYLLQPTGCRDQNATWYGGRTRTRRLCVRWGPRSAPKKGVQPPNFRPLFIVAKRLDGSRR